jgi:hypothetical protein
MTTWYVARLLGPVAAGPFATKAEAKEWIDCNTAGIRFSKHWRQGLYEYLTGFPGRHEDRSSYFVGTVQALEQDGWSIASLNNPKQSSFVVDKTNG